MDGSTKRFPLTFTYLLKICNLLEIESNEEEEPFGGTVSLTALPLDLILPLQASQHHRLLPWPLEESPPGWESLSFGKRRWRLSC